MNTATDSETLAKPAPLFFDTHPERYAHWKLSFEGEVATLAMDVNEDKGLKPGYKLKLNSYDLGVDIELYDALNRIRFEHPEVKVVVLTSAKDRMFCSGANIYMLGLSSHGWKVNFCKFTNETRNGIEDSSRDDGLKFLAAVNGACAGGGYELALACDEILMIDDRSSAVSLPEVPLLGVLPGTGGLTRLTDKRKVRRDLADVFCTTTEGVRAERARQWKLVDHVAKPQVFKDAIRQHAANLARQSGRPGAGKGVTLTPVARNADANGYHYTRRCRPAKCGRHTRRRRPLVASGHGTRTRRCHPDAAHQPRRGRHLAATDARRGAGCARHRRDTKSACQRLAGEGDHRTAAPHPRAT